MERHYVYQGLINNGSSLAVREGRYLYYGPSSGGPCIASILGEWISVGTLVNTAHSDYRLAGNRVYAGAGGTVVFTIDGTHICDGVSISSPFLYCPTGDRIALAMAACAFIGDMRLRPPGVTPLDPSTYSSGQSPNIKDDSYNHRLLHPTITDQFYGKTSEPEQRLGGGRSWSPLASENIHQMKKPISINSQYPNDRPGPPVWPESPKIDNDWGKGTLFVTTEQIASLQSIPDDPNSPSMLYNNRRAKVREYYERHPEILDNLLEEERKKQHPMIMFDQVDRYILSAMVAIFMIWSYISPTTATIACFIFGIMQYLWRHERWPGALILFCCSVLSLLFPEFRIIVLWIPSSIVLACTLEHAIYWYKYEMKRCINKRYDYLLSFTSLIDD